MAILSPILFAWRGAALALVLAVTFPGALGPDVARAQAPSVEHAVKAAYLYKFAPFVSWPPGAMGGPSAPLAVCVMGPDGFGPALVQAARNERMGERGFQPKRLARVARGECHILYVVGRPADVRETLAAVHGSPVLTVTDTAGPGPKGVINFVLRDSRVRFEIDLKAAADNGLGISSKLAALAVTTSGGRE